jgi:hypothetical protein
LWLGVGLQDDVVVVWSLLGGGWTRHVVVGWTSHMVVVGTNHLVVGTNHLAGNSSHLVVDMNHLVVVVGMNHLETGNSLHSTFYQ